MGESVASNFLTAKNSIAVTNPAAKPKIFPGLVNIVASGFTIITIPANPSPIAIHSCRLILVFKNINANIGIKIGVVFSKTFAFTRLVS